MFSGKRQWETYHQEVNTVKKRIVTDPNGSYTGRPRDPEETPVQDADDL